MKKKTALFGCVLTMASVLLYACQSAEELKREQYFAEGYQLYTTNCANCHQDNGQGLANLYPSLSDSKIFQQPALMACMIRYGTKGEKNGRPMPANSKLTELEIAEVMTYVKVKWGKDSLHTSTEDVALALKECGAH